MTSTGNPQPFHGRSLSGHSRDSIHWSPFMGRPRDAQAVLCFSQSEGGPSAAPTVTAYGQDAGRPQVVWNRKLIFPYSSWFRGLSQSERGPCVTDGDALQTGSWSSSGRPSPVVSQSEPSDSPGTGSRSSRCPLKPHGSWVSLRHHGAAVLRSLAECLLN